MARNAAPGPMGPYGIPNRGQLSQFVVNRAGWEGIKQTLYDFTSYAAAGENTLNFFATPNGQGGKTFSDTNMTLAGQLPTNQEFLVTGLQVIFFPTVPTVAADMPAFFGAQANLDSINDVYIFRRSGNLTFIIGSKPYLQEAPMSRFCPKNTFHLEAAVADQTTIAADLQTRVGYADVVGVPYVLAPGSLLLTSNQNFSISLNWPEGLQAITNPARVGVVLDGFLYRRSQ